ncbi:AAA domain-containing protein [Actinokineospora alba]|uniref:AAA domain-containing protein n=1 Tax=Actinokineospora alba TaxID=504798 RepID=A0A1H0LY04_9PSEU|nr:LuxR family transcriptional regulator [Actinokineospora alba]TDP67504.1 AAA domain-containing protein [Actinokineospora alba]SDI46847.1 AAA domain-containing protein [Actinokineospora alba]SDO73078.1 AAA domain-containing protein [Actinokineospora alba]
MAGSESLVAEVVAVVTAPPAVVVITGDAGMGKSWLVERVLDAAGRGRVVVGCRGLPDGPYVLVRELVSGLGRGDPGPVLAAVEADELHRVCEALRDLLDARLVVVEDVECADHRSRQVLRYLVTRPPEHAALLLTWTPGAEPPLGTRLTSAASTGVHHVEVGPLTAAEVAALGDGSHADEVRELTAGVPVLVRALVNHLEHDGPREALARKGIPQPIAELVDERLSRLPERARQVVDAAALSRGPVSVPLLSEVCGLGPPEVETALAAAVDAGVLVSTDGRAFAFHPPITGIAVVRMLHPVERRRLHAAYVAALRQRDEDALPDLVFHSRLAGELVAAARYAERAAQHTNPAEAVELLQELLSEPDLPRPERGALAVRLGRLALSSLAYDETVALLRDILADGRLPAGLRGELRLDLGLLLGNQAGDGDTGRAQLRIAVTELARRPALAARTMSALAVPFWGNCHVEEHLRWLAEVERTVPDRGDPVLLLATAVNRASTLAQLGDPRAWDAIAALPDDGATTGERRELLRGCANFSDAAIALGHHAAAADFLTRAADLAGRSGPSYPWQMATSNRLRLDHVTGRWDGLVERARAYLESATHTTFVAVDASLVLAQLALARGEWDEAEEYLGAHGLRSMNGWYGPVVICAAATRVRLALVRGRGEEAVGELSAAVEILRLKGVWAWATELVDAGVEALLHTGDLPRARRLLDEFAADVEGRDCPFAHAMVPFGRAAIAAARDRLDEAAALYGEAATLLAALPRPYEQARALEAAARCLPPSPGQLAEASRLFTALGATWDLARCDHLVREHGGTTGARPGRRGYGTELSPRERQVARLLALGRTNRQIAEVLFLSPRTVERHAARVLHKLGAPDRDALRPEDHS